MKISILGGGISGLSAAFSIANRFKNVKVKLFESTSRYGGWIKTEKRKNNVIFEAGPRTIRPKGIAGNSTLELIEVLGLQKKVIPITSQHVAAKRRMIFANNQLCLLPNDLKGVTNVIAPFSQPLYKAGIKDFFGGKSKEPKSDESIYDFVERRFGKEIADYAISSMICGICAGDAKEISVKFLMKELFEKEQKYGSVTRGLLLDLIINGAANKQKSKFEPTLLMQRAKHEKWSIYSLEGGLETLPKSMVERMSTNENVQLNLNSKCEKISFSPNGQIELTINGKKSTCDHLISSLPSQQLAPLFEHQHPTLTNELNDIKSVDVAVINLHYNSEVLKEQGFGVLVPPIEKLPILGIIFDSCCFKMEGQTVLTVMAGGKWFEKWFGKFPTDQKILNIALKQVEKILGISVKPDSYKMNIMKNCIPQYVVGHHDRIDRIRNYIEENNLPLKLCGASFDGVGVNDVIYSAVKAVNSLKLNEN
jgi:protoporphyrinogen/coproporphyrinogen III oxidase